MSKCASGERQKKDPSDLKIELNFSKIVFYLCRSSENTPQLSLLRKFFNGASSIRTVTVYRGQRTFIARLPSFLQILLMVLFRGPKFVFTQWHQLSDGVGHGAAQDIPREFPMCAAPLRSDERPIARANIIPLSVELGRVVYLEEDLKQLGVRYPRLVKGHRDSLGVACGLRDYLIVSRLGRRPADVTHARPSHPRSALERKFDGPEAARCEVSRGGRGVSGGTEAATACGE